MWVVTPLKFVKIFIWEEIAAFSALVDGNILFCSEMPERRFISGMAIDNVGVGCCYWDRFHHVHSFDTKSAPRISHQIL